MKSDRLQSDDVRNFFKGISVSSICAGALAAVTSFLFSAKIGIAGSVIGVAAGSIVSAVATQVYKNVLKASGEKIQNAVPLPSASDSEKKEDAASSDNATTSVGEETRVISSTSDTDETMVLPSSVQPTRNISGTEHSQIQQGNQTGARNTGGSRFSTWLQGKHAPIVIAVVSALIGVAISAGLILAFTDGKGTDTVVRERIVHSYTDTGNDSQEQLPSSGHTTNPSTSNGNGSDSTQSDSSQSGQTGQSGTSGSTNSGTSNGTSNSTSGNSSSSNTKNSTKNDSTSNDSTGTSTNDSSNQQGSDTQDSTSQGSGSSGTDSTGDSTSTDGSGTSSDSTSSGDSSDSTSSDTSSSTGSSN